MPKTGSSEDDDHGVQRLARSSSENETAPRRRSSRHAAKRKLEEEEGAGAGAGAEAEAPCVPSTNPKDSKDSGTTISFIELTLPKKQGKRSARAKAKNPTPWAPLEKLARLLLNSEEDAHAHNATLKKRKLTGGGGSSMPLPCSEFNKAPKLMQSSCDEYSSAELPAIEEGIAGPGLADNKNRGKRSVRGRKLAPWRSLGLTMLMNGRRELTNVEDPAVEADMAGRVDPSQCGRLSGRLRGKKRTSYASLHMFYDSETRDHKNGQRHCPKKTKFAHGGPTPCHASEGPAEVKESCGKDFHLAGNANVDDSIADTVADHSDNSGVLSTAPPQVIVQKSKLVKENNAESGPEIFSALNLDACSENLDLSSAELCLAYLYGQSERDSCIEFAVKILMGEIPLGKEAAEVEEFFSRKINSDSSTIVSLFEGFQESHNASLQVEHEKISEIFSIG